MNHLNCFVIEAIASELNNQLNGSKLVDCFSNSPDEILFVFESFNFKCLFFQSEIYFTFNDSDVSKSRLYKPQFSELLELKIVSVISHHFERSFEVNFENNNSLIFKCHGRKSNLLLFQNQGFIDLFRKNLEKDAELPQNTFKSRIPEFRNPDFICSKEKLKLQCPFLPEEFQNELGDSFQLDELEALVLKYQHISGFKYNTDTELLPVFSGNSILNDLSYFSRSHIKLRRFIFMKTSHMKQLEHKIGEKRTFLNANRIALEQLQNKRSDEEIGNIILANLHQIPPSSKKVLLNDIYNNQNIEIKLDDQLSAVDNAAKYFKKAKGIPHTLRLLSQKIEQAEKDLIGLESQLNILLQSDEWKDLKPLLKQITQQDTNTDLPYRKFNEQGFDILVGKNAESNEKILNYFSDKDDIWLHAKDVSGSHVLIKCPKNKKLPESVLLKAAAIAAYYSKNRNQSLATVTYTLRKYVRKIKGAEKGKVTVSNESTVLVKPKLN